MRPERILSTTHTESNPAVLLRCYIKSQDLTSALTLIEGAGYSGELAIFVLAHAQTALEVGE